MMSISLSRSATGTANSALLRLRSVKSLRDENRKLRFTTFA